jgi:hypothetical protein
MTMSTDPTAEVDVQDCFLEQPVSGTSQAQPLPTGQQCSPDVGMDVRLLPRTEQARLPRGPGRNGAENNDVRHISRQRPPTTPQPVEPTRRDDPTIPEPVHQSIEHRFDSGTYRGRGAEHLPAVTKGFSCHLQVVSVTGWMVGDLVATPGYRWRFPGVVRGRGVYQANGNFLTSLSTRLRGPMIPTA